MKPDIAKAQKHLKRVRALAAQSPSRFKGMTMQQVINEIRKTREQLWEEKLALHSGHK